MHLSVGQIQCFCFRLETHSVSLTQLLQHTADIETTPSCFLLCWHCVWEECLIGSGRARRSHGTGVFGLDVSSAVRSPYLSSQFVRKNAKLPNAGLFEIVLTRVQFRRGLSAAMKGRVHRGLKTRSCEFPS